MGGPEPHRWDAAGGRVTGWLDAASERFADRRRLVLGLAGASRASVPFTCLPRDVWFCFVCEELEGLMALHPPIHPPLFCVCLAGVLLVVGVALNVLNRDDSGASSTGGGFGHPGMQGCVRLPRAAIDLNTHICTSAESYPFSNTQLPNHAPVLP